MSYLAVMPTPERHPAQAGIRPSLRSSQVFSLEGSRPSPDDGEDTLSFPPPTSSPRRRGSIQVSVHRKYPAWMDPGLRRMTERIRCHSHPQRHPRAGGDLSKRLFIASIQPGGIPAFAGMTERKPGNPTPERHPRAGGDPSKSPFIASIQPGWIPAFAGMTEMDQSLSSRLPQPPRLVLHAHIRNNPIEQQTRAFE